MLWNQVPEFVKYYYRRMQTGARLRAGLGRRSIFRQMSCEPHPVPSYIVVGAGTGGTATTIGRGAGGETASFVSFPR